MNWIEEVRQVLEWSRDLHNGRQRHSDWGWHYEISMCKLAIDKALAAIPEEPEMMRLLKWLWWERNHPFFWGVWSDCASTYARVIRKIEREFGYKLHDEKPKP